MFSDGLAPAAPFAVCAAPAVRPARPIAPECAPFFVKQLLSADLAPNAEALPASESCVSLGTEEKALSSLSSESSSSSASRIRDTPPARHEPLPESFPRIPPGIIDRGFFLFLSINDNRRPFPTERTSFL